MSEKFQKTFENYKTNLKLCQLVKKYPCLYDGSSANNINKWHYVSAWNQIALEMGKSVDFCKYQWQYILDGYKEYLKKIEAISGEVVQPYFLAPDLSFIKKHLSKNIPSVGNKTAVKVVQKSLNTSVLPKVKVRTLEPNRSNKTDQIFQVYEVNSDSGSDKDNIQPTSEAKRSHSIHRIKGDAIKIKAELDQPKCKTSSQTKIRHQSEEDLSLDEMKKELDSENESPQSRKCHRYEENMSEIDLEEYIESPTNITKQHRNLFKEYAVIRKLQNIDRDFAFLTSILPDMKSMNSRQKVLFKKRVYQNLEEIFSDCRDFPPNKDSMSVNSQTSITNMEMETKRSSHRNIVTLNPQRINQAPIVKHENKSEKNVGDC